MSLGGQIAVIGHAIATHQPTDEWKSDDNLLIIDFATESRAIAGALVELARTEATETRAG